MGARRNVVVIGRSSNKRDVRTFRLIQSFVWVVIQNSKKNYMSCHVIIIPILSSVLSSRSLMIARTD